ncbi:MAG: hypothetical protein D6757_05145 [Alphaproteobacteria bacterium]|nr:MAG: hypothetical protein D6757_05145 [Alphaproteobacteria bacterium]
MIVSEYQDPVLTSRAASLLLRDQDRNVMVRPLSTEELDHVHGGATLGCVFLAGVVIGAAGAAIGIALGEADKVEVKAEVSVNAG